MKMVVLFGGGDGGGLIITDNGVRPIPPFDPGLRQLLRSAAAAVNAAAAAKGESRRGKMAKLSTSLCNLAVEQVEEVVGPLDGERAIVYQDDDGGFTCGSTGKPPIPIPWPPQSLPTISDLIASGAIEKDLVEFVQRAQASNIAMTEMFENPAEISRKLGISLSEKTAKDIQYLAPSRLNQIADPTEREIVGFYHKVIADGRFVETWFSRPYQVAQDLKFKLSDAALERIAAGGAVAGLGSLGGFGPRADMGLGIVVVTAADIIIIGITIAVSNRRAIGQNVKDRSRKAHEKF